jgi:peptidoglycan/xylan/chitin deacetylase (PgdA/CDA1 family)
MTRRSQRGAAAQWRWPGGAEAAVSLTYDDGRENHLDLAIPDLELFRFRGTFYLTHDNPYVEWSVDRWREAFSRGHEIGNHSYNHPSRVDLSGYDSGDILAEVGHGALWLKRLIGPDPERSYAYPGGVTAIGTDNKDQDSYTEAISRYHRVARAAGGPPNDPLDVRPPIAILSASLFDTPEGFRLDELRNYCEAARRHGRWAVIMFHDVVAAEYEIGAGQINQNVHRQFLGYLRVEPFWVAPVKEVADYIFRQTSATKTTYPSPHTRRGDTS